MSAPSLDFIIQQLHITDIPSFTEIETLKQKLETWPNPNFQALEQCRMAGSNSLKRGEELHNWLEANKLILNWIANNDELEFKKIISMNAVLKPLYKGAYRDHSIFAAMGEFVDHKELHQFQNFIEKNILSISHHPLVRASILYQAISTFHPFFDGNGRTARLIADYELIRHGYLPLSFENPFDGMCGIKSNSLQTDGNYGIRKLVKWLTNSYKIVMTSEQ